MKTEKNFDEIKWPLVLAALTFFIVLALVAIFGWYECAKTNALGEGKINQLNDEIRRSHQKIEELMRQK